MSINSSVVEEEMDRKDVEVVGMIWLTRISHRCRQHNQAVSNQVSKTNLSPTRMCAWHSKLLCIRWTGPSVWLKPEGWEY